MSTVTRKRRGFTIVRHLNAPRELVFRAWTDPEHLHWFTGSGPAEHPTTVDLRVGGAWRFHMVENDDRKYTTGGIYREIVEPEKLVFAWGAVDGWPAINPDNLDDAPQVTIEFKENHGGTEMVFDVGFADSLSDDRVLEWLGTGMTEGWNVTVARLTDEAIAARP